MNLRRGNRSQVRSRRGLDERPRRRGAPLGTRVRHDSPKTTDSSSFPNFTFFFFLPRCGQQELKYDPIYYASTQHQNAVPQTIFNERGLALVAVPWPWANALKLVRYAKQDPIDCAAVLRLGVAQRGIRWTLAGLEQWIMERCWPVGYTGYQPPQKQQFRQRIQDALNRADEDRSTAIDSFFCIPRSEFPCGASALPLLVSPFLLKLLFIYRI